MGENTNLNLWIPIAIPVISGLFALLGGFLGAWLTRRTEYDKWLRHERSVAFSEFIRQLNATALEAINILAKQDSMKDNCDLLITDLFCRLNGPENVVRLYLDEADRDEFSGLLKEYWILHSPKVKIERRIKEGKKKLEMIQAIFEKTLHL